MNEFDDRAATWDEDPDKHERARAVADAIARQVPLRPSMTALEYGCGTGALSFALRGRFADVTLADSSDGMLAVLADKLAAWRETAMHPLKLDLLVDPLPKRRYDVVYSLMTLHHVPDTQALLRKFFALLARPGYLCIADLDREDGSFHGAGFTGHNGFDRDALASQTIAAGFHPPRFKTAHVMEKRVGEKLRRYPVFLMVAEAR